MSNRKLAVTMFVLAALACSLFAVPSRADSQVRIVRLSQVEGDVQVDRNAGQGYEKAFLNLPVTEGTKLRANKDARAEVEFEDGSTLRVTPGTVVEFTELTLRESGAKASTVNVKEGTAYLNFTGTKDSQFQLTFGRERVTFTKAAHLRLEVGNTDATLAMFKGDARVEGPSGTVEVGKKQSASFDFEDQDRSTLAKNLERDPYDEWDKQQGQYHQQYSSRPYNSYSPYAYGVSDLNYYGSFFNAPGYGMMWQPYFVGAGWDPFMDGAWLWYPGFGYTWVSSYPWGWTPYRYGSWRFLPGYGWAWQPGGAGIGWRPIPVVVNPPGRFTPPHPPTAPGQTTIVSRRPPAMPVATAPHQVVIRNDSAGLGIPRGRVSDLGKLSQQVKAQGFAAAPIHAAPVRSVAPMWQRSSSGMAAPTGTAASTHASGSQTSAPAMHSSAPSPHTGTGAGPHK